MRQKENRPGAGDAYGTVPYNCINDITDICESQSIAYDDLLEAVTLAYLSDIDTDLSPDFSTVKVEFVLLVTEYNFVELMSYFVIAEGRAEAKTFATTKSASTTAEIISEYEPPRKAL